MRVCHRTHQGLVRANNQDNWLAESALYGVADGMGGHKGGETASRVALQVFRNAIGQKKPDADALRMAVEAANRRVYDMSARDDTLSGMGTTMSMIWQDTNRLLIAHVGDSRIYRLRAGQFQQITDDHSFVAELVRNNIITPEFNGVMGALGAACLARPFSALKGKVIVVFIVQHPRRGSNFGAFSVVDRREINFVGRCPIRFVKLAVDLDGVFDAFHFHAPVGGIVLGLAEFFRSLKKEKERLIS